MYSQTGPAGIGTSANNVLWLKADAGTSSITNNTPISSWNDQSGNSINVTQTVSVKQPSFATNVFNGFPAISFDNIKTNNDKLTAPDSPILDNTSGYTFFTITRPVSYEAGGNDARVILSKRNNVDTEESFMLFHYSNNYLYVDLQTTNNRFNSSSTSYPLGTNCLIDLVYDGSLTSGSRSKLYSSGALIKTAAETSTLIPDNNSPLVIGSTDNGDPRPFGGYIGEIIIYREALNKASRIIIDNYLSAKYNITLSTNDKYAGDDSGNGDYDRDVAGIGQDTIMPGSVVGSNLAFSSSAAAGLGISVNSGLDNGDYIMAGNASASNGQIITDIGGLTGTNNARWQRVWYIDVTNTSTNINTNIEFDMSDGGVNTVLGTTSNYVLLFRAGQSGNWTELTTASSVSGDKVLFNGINLSTDGYYTIGTRDYTASPLPIELISFNAIMNGNKVDINWTTATEINNDYFVIEKSKNGINFETLTKLDAAGNSTSIINYTDVDLNPYTGISYYRLKQIDFNGTFSYSKIEAVNYKSDNNGISIFPNPTDKEINLILTGLENNEVLVVIRDMTGKECYSKVIVTTENNQLFAIDPEQKLATGTYIVVATSDNRLYSQKLIVK
ncbi:MAG: T9SS type A sorting domain-containing protein [Bacteroidia bacterium]|nr:T9SS type A sorting domain-containing protein [Bacteroidia bacterium]